MKFRCNYNLWVLTLVFSTWNSLLGQNEVYTKDTVKNVPKVLILHSRYRDNKERNQLVYNETANIVYDRLKKNLDKLNIQKVEGNNKQFVHHVKSNLIEITDTKQNPREFSKQVEIIVLLESINKTANAESSELLINSIRSPVYNFQEGACVDENEFFKSIIKLIPTSELNLQILPSGINAVIRVNL